MKYALSLVGIVILSFGCTTKDTIELRSSYTHGDGFVLLNGSPISEDMFNKIVQIAAPGEIDIIVQAGNDESSTRMDLVDFRNCMESLVASPMSFSEFDVMRYHILGDKLIVEFHEESLQSSFSQSGITTTFTTNQSARTLEITILETLAGAQMSQTTENGNEVVPLEFPNFDSQTDKVVYRDEEGIHEIPFAGVRNQPFEFYKPEPIDLNGLFQ